MSDDERAIRKLIDDWMEASQVENTQKILSLMTDDVVFMVPGRAPFGKEAFAATSKGLDGAALEGTSEIEELKVLGDWAWCRNRLAITVTPANGKPVRRSGYTLTIFRKENGAWLLARDANLLTAQGETP